MQFPLNSTKFFLSQKLSQNFLETTINGSIVLPERWFGLLPPYYEQYILLDFNVFPLNSTDLVISGRYYKGTYSGTLTIHLVPGLTVGDVELDVEGNTTYVKIYDSIEIFYNQTLPILGFTPPSRDFIEEISLKKDYIDQILYQATGGLVVCELYNVTIVPRDRNSDIIYVKIVLRGNFMEILARIYEQILAQTMGVPYDQRELIGKIARDLVNATLESIERASFRISYIRSIRGLDFNFNLLTNLERAQNMTSQILVGDLPPDLQQYLKDLLRMRYVKAKSYEEKLSYESGVAQYVGKYILEGDINAELNLIKELYINMLAKSAPSQDQILWQLQFVNKTKVVDVSNFKFNLSQNIKYRPYESVTSISFRGIKVTPPINQINATCFRMERLFDFAYSMRSGRLKIIIKGESNGTRTVIPIIAEGTPPPDNVSANNTFVWNNVEFDDLRDLTFKVYEGSVYAVFKNFVSSEKPYIISAPGAANCQVTINSVQSNIILIVRGSFTLPEGVAAPSEKYRVLGGYVQITSEGGEASGSFMIRIYYDKRELTELNIDENSLKIHFWDQSAGKWTPVETHLNVKEHYAWANVDHLSVWALMGEVVSKPIWAEWWFITLIIVVIVAAVSLIALRRRRAASAS
ncbi:MAG: hypothetical protein QXX94_03585 [Candidatus Bathyarchaeia archaeon]